MMVQTGLRRDPFDQSHIDPTACMSVSVCVQNRQQISREIDRKLLRLQDETLDDVQLRLLNEEANKLVRLFDLWNYRIKQLGGRKEDKEFYEQGTEVVQRRGFHFYGRAKDLPEAKEKEEALQRQAEADAFSIKQEELLSRVDEFYFGHEQMSTDCLVELDHLENFLASEEGPFELCGAKKLVYDRSSPEILVPDFDIPTTEEAMAALVAYRKQRLISTLKSKLETM